MFLFNVRAYGILINSNNEVLISDERVESAAFTKFPGGGLEYGEGLIDALKREYMEECELQIEVVKHLYTTDFFEKSSFNQSQIISVYYEVKPLENMNIDIKTRPFDFDTPPVDGKQQSFRLEPIDSVQPTDFTFKTDQIAWQSYLATR